MQGLGQAANAMTSRYVYEWKFAKNEKASAMGRTAKLRLVPSGYMGIEAFDVATFSGAARRGSQRLLDSEAARRKDRDIASMDVDKAFLKGLT